MKKIMATKDHTAATLCQFGKKLSQYEGSLWQRIEELCKPHLNFLETLSEEKKAFYEKYSVENTPNYLTFEDWYARQTALTLSQYLISDC